MTELSKKKKVGSVSYFRIFGSKNLMTFFGLHPVGQSHCSDCPQGRGFFTGRLGSVIQLVGELMVTRFGTFCRLLNVLMYVAWMCMWVGGWSAGH